MENIELAIELCKNCFFAARNVGKSGTRRSYCTISPRNFPDENSNAYPRPGSAKNSANLSVRTKPTGALSYQTQKRLESIATMCRKEKKTVIVVTHNSALKEMADKVIYLKNGRAEQIEKNDSVKDIEEIEW